MFTRDERIQLHSRDRVSFFELSPYLLASESFAGGLGGAVAKCASVVLVIRRGILTRTPEGIAQGIMTDVGIHNMMLETVYKGAGQ